MLEDDNTSMQMDAHENDYLCSTSVLALSNMGIIGTGMRGPNRSWSRLVMIVASDFLTLLTTLPKRLRCISHASNYIFVNP